jgi:alkaline phosphatase D
MLGEPQRRWLERELKRSVTGGTPWQLLGNQVVMARVAGPRLDLLMGEAQAAKIAASLPPDIRGQVEGAMAAFKAGVPYKTDTWDGYPAARERLYAAFREAGAHPIVLSGDSHAFWANDLYDDGGRLVASEFGTSQSPARPTRMNWDRSRSASCWRTPTRRSSTATRRPRAISC